MGDRERVGERERYGRDVIEQRNVRKKASRGIPTIKMTHVLRLSNLVFPIRRPILQWFQNQLLKGTETMGSFCVTAGAGKCPPRRHHGA